MAHNRLCIYIIHYVQFIILGENPGIWKLWTDYGHYELPEPLMYNVSEEFSKQYFKLGTLQADVYFRNSVLIFCIALRTRSHGI